MRRLLYLLSGVAVLGVLGWNVWRNEALISSGQEVLLALAPVDPRSLMQGDYMALRWDLERESRTLTEPTGAVVLGLDGRRVGTVKRLADGAPLAPEEMLFAVKADPQGGLVLEPHSFLFQEGTADAFAKAKFGIFRVAPDGRHLLVGLADEAARKIQPPVK
jgi:uncharacterized membrane-anchored protein